MSDDDERKTYTYHHREERVLSSSCIVRDYTSGSTVSSRHFADGTNTETVDTVKGDDPRRFLDWGLNLEGE